MLKYECHPLEMKLDTWVLDTLTSHARKVLLPTLNTSLTIRMDCDEEGGTPRNAVVTVTCEGQPPATCATLGIQVDIPALANADLSRVMEELFSSATFRYGFLQTFIAKMQVAGLLNAD